MKIFDWFKDCETRHSGLECQQSGAISRLLKIAQKFAADEVVSFMGCAVVRSKWRASHLDHWQSHP